MPPMVMQGDRTRRIAMSLARLCMIWRVTQESSALMDRVLSDCVAKQHAF